MRDAEGAKNTDKSRELPGYRGRSPGLKHLADALAVMRPLRAQVSGLGLWVRVRRRRRLLRVGSGAVRGPIIRTIITGSLPFVRACLWDLPPDLGRTDYGYCADVMGRFHCRLSISGGVAEHHGTRQACYFQIALFDDDRFGS